MNNLMHILDGLGLRHSKDGDEGDASLLPRVEGAQERAHTAERNLVGRTLTQPRGFL